MIALNGLTRILSESTKFRGIALSATVIALGAVLAGCVNNGAMKDEATTAAAKTEIKGVSRGEFNNAVRSMRRGERWGRYEQSVKSMKEYLKKKHLSADQKFTLLEYIAIASSKLGDEKYAKALAAFKALPDSKKKRKALSFFMVKMIMPLNFRAAEKLYAEESKGLDAYSNLALLQEFSKNALWALDDEKTFDIYWNKVKTLPNPDAGNKGKAARFESRRKSALLRLIADLSSYSPKAAEKLLADSRSRLNDGNVSYLLAAFAKSAVKFEDRPRFDAVLARLKKMPMSQAKVRAYLDIANSLWRIDKDLGEKILRSAIRNDNPTDEQRFALLGGIMRLRRISGFNYGFSRSGPSGYGYKTFRTLAKEMEAILDEGKIKKNNTIAMFHCTVAETAVDFGDYENGAEEIAKAYEIWPTNSKVAFLAAEAAMRSKNKPRAEKILSAIIANKRTRPDDRLVAKGLLFLNGGGSVENVAEAWKNESLKPARKMVMLRKVSEKLYRLGRYGDVRKLDAMVNKMFKPLLVKRYTCRYIPDCPKNADSWAHSKYYDDWDAMETRFSVYGDGYGISTATDIKRHLKGAVEPKPNPAYKTGVQIVYDDQGVHIFVRCDDPKLKQVLLGEGSAGSLEMLLKPGENAAYHSWYFNLPGTVDPYIVNWETPNKHYRMTYDYFKKDSATTLDAIVAHTFIPWMMFYDKLPSKSNQWLFGMQRFGRCRLALSGLVHEIGRSVRLDFDFTKRQMTNLKRSVCLMAFNKYDKLRKDERGAILIWKDEKLGDPEFFKTELEPLLKELDDAGVKLKTPAKDAEIDAIFAKYVPLWAEINYVVADKRKQYLKSKFLK